MEKDSSGKQLQGNRTNAYRLLLKRAVQLSDPLQERVTHMWKKVEAAVPGQERLIAQKPFGELYFGVNVRAIGEGLNSNANHLFDSLCTSEASSSLTATTRKFSSRSSSRGQKRLPRAARLSLEIASPVLDKTISQFREALLDNGLLLDDEQLSSRRITLGHLEPELSFGRGDKLLALMGGIVVRGYELELGPAELQCLPADQRQQSS